MPRYDAIVFDLDHTLFDSDLSEALALEATFTAAGIAVTRALLETYDNINQQLWRALERGETDLATLRVQRFSDLSSTCGLDVDADALADSYSANLGSHGALLPGARALLDTVSTGNRLGLLTNGVGTTQRLRLDLWDLDRYFEAVVVSGEFGAAKPRPEIFAEIMRLLDLFDPAAVVMVGDSLTSDMRGATDFGMATCWYNAKGAAAPAEMALTHVATSLDDIALSLV